MEEELPFAGHPVIGASAFLHSELYSAEEVVPLEFVIQDRSISTVSRRQGASYMAEMDQGIVTAEPPISAAKSEAFLKALNLSITDLAPDLPLQVVFNWATLSNCGRLTRTLKQAKIVVQDFEAMLATVGAKFVYVLQVGRLEGRTWDNDGRVEDIATGSAAGPAAAYLVLHNRASPNEDIILLQGRFLNRPSELYASVKTDKEMTATIKGQVCSVGNGTLRLPIE